MKQNCVWRANIWIWRQTVWHYRGAGLWGQPVFGNTGGLSQIRHLDWLFWGERQPNTGWKLPTSTDPQAPWINTQWTISLPGYILWNLASQGSLILRTWAMESWMSCAIHLVQAPNSKCRMPWRESYQLHSNFALPRSYSCMLKYKGLWVGTQIGT